ncbi:proline racemase family protein [Halolamina salifodinae]|uniref:Trans-L-3-hydroxyproline dehydratase n=1 Tax=Halolamina salifodinae TaxID=1202767 RepID=A0A8T4GUP8_9EURY|nr:proline racemase family protein [Halolamina salifodinae]MBP1986841.1 trans-L-3-hydroxyproline dehydratase [Halolamina salifodinae]
MGWEPPPNWPRITTVESHTGGEPLRVVIDGFPEIPGDTILEKRRYVRDNHDQLRSALMLEPRGHANMYGALLTEPVTPDGDIGVLFTHNEGYSTMCGHGVIALGVVLPEIDAVDVRAATPTIEMDTPAGRVTAHPQRSEGEIERVAFENVPSYVERLDEETVIPEYGPVTYDVAFGGAYYAYCDASEFDIELGDTTEREFVDIGRTVKAAIAEDISLTHPADDDLGFLYGVILTEEPKNEANIRNVCIFADGEIDRSPTGTGVSGHLAIQHAKGALEPGEEFVVESLINSTFIGRIAERTTFHGYDAVVPVIEGKAYITGTSEFTIDPADPFKEGFVLR